MPAISIRTSLTAMFVALMAAIALVGCIGLWNLSAVNETVVRIGTNALPSINVTRKLQVDLGQFRVRQARHVMSESGDEKHVIDGEIGEARSSIESDLKAYDVLIDNAEERTNYAAIRKTLDAYFRLNETLLELSNGGKTADAVALFKGELRAALQATNKTVDAAVDMNEKMSAVEVQASAVAYNQAFFVLAFVSVGALLLGVASIAFALIRVLRPIGSMTHSMGVLANGDMAVAIPGVGRTDEIGKMADAVQIFKTNMIETERLRAEQAAAETRAIEQRKADMRALADRFQAAVGTIVETVSSASGQLEGAASSLTKTAEMTQSQSGLVAAASEETSANVQGVAAAAEQLASTVTEISRQVQQSSTIADRAVTQAADTNNRVSELSQSATRIGDVIELINSIAGQTNLLALNATIEAARAGDAGKGFAVVAQEVKALASQTAKATSEIAQQIASMQDATSQAVTAIHEISATINQMSEISVAISAAVEEQGATAQEISRNVSEAAKGTAEVAANITDVNRGAAETGSASTQVLSSARQLASESTTLRREVETFLSTVRAA